MIVKTSMAAPDIIIRNGTDIKVWYLNLFSFGFICTKRTSYNNLQYFSEKVGHLAQPADPHPPSP